MIRGQTVLGRVDGGGDESGVGEGGEGNHGRQRQR